MVPTMSLPPSMLLTGNKYCSPVEGCCILLGLSHYPWCIVYFIILQHNCSILHQLVSMCRKMDNDSPEPGMTRRATDESPEVARWHHEHILFNFTCIYDLRPNGYKLCFHCMSHQLSLRSLRLWPEAKYVICMFPLNVISVSEKTAHSQNLKPYHQSRELDWWSSEGY